MSMRSVMSIAIQAKFIETLRRTLGSIQTQLSFRFFCTQTTHNQDSLCKRIEKLPKGESISSAFRSWMRDGFPVRGTDVFHTINRLRKLNFNKRALEIIFQLISTTYRINAYE
ncbi:PPR containing plant-like protein [Trifolium pratense]|uniref:PPR containing plant-like protein n=1 Tax=Trifolium pratense TaxID=57577 RepID=A0A2K3JTF4_TRIPR|nr:PPR containing plant-like protein [Trifolium pratense]